MKLNRIARDGGVCGGSGGKDLFDGAYFEPRAIAVDGTETGSIAGVLDGLEASNRKKVGVGFAAKLEDKVASCTGQRNRRSFGCASRDEAARGFAQDDTWL
jgi:hypothetical protein